MYGLPADFDPSVFVGRDLESVTFAVNTIVLSFSDRLAVSISGRVPYRGPKSAESGVDDPPVSRTTLTTLVGHKVRGFDLLSPRELVLDFGDGGSITLLDDSDTYESYLINTGDREIIV